MSAFVDNILNGPWNVQCANGQYLAASSSQTNTSGNPLATTLAERTSAAQLTFQQVSAVSDTRVLVTAQVEGGGSYLAVDAQSQVVFTASAGTPAQFTAVQTGNGTFALGQGVSGDSGSFVTLDATGNTFTLVSSAPGSSADLYLAPDLPVGAQLWSFTTAQAMVGTPYVYQGAVFMGDGDTLLNCVDMLTGKVLWEYGDGTAAVCPPEVNYANALVFTADGDGLLRAVNLNTGEEVWTFQSSAPVYARPSAYVGHLFVPSSDGVLYALSTETGAQRWRYPATGDLSGIFSSPAMAGKTVFVGSWDNQVHAVDVGTGVEVWSYDAGNKVNGDLETDGDTVYFGTDDNELVALKQSDGSERWVFGAGGIVTGRPLVYGGAVYFGDYAGDFYAVDAATGDPLWTETFSGYIGSAAQAADGVVYFNTVDGTLYALDASTGATLATYAAGAQLDGSAVLYSGALYFGTQGGEIVSVGQGLGDAFNPVNALALLYFSGYANLAQGETQHDTSRLPAWCTQLGEFRWTDADEFSAGAVLQLTLPGTDQPVVVLAMGVQTDTFPMYFDSHYAPLADLPAAILGTQPAAGAQANQSLLDSYLDARTALLAALQGTAGSTVVVAGFGGGGALAALAALDLSIPKTGVPAPGALSLLTFGAPATGNQAFATLLEQQLPGALRVVGEGDPFPGILTSAKGYAQAGAQVSVGSAAVIAAGGGPQSTVSFYQMCLSGQM